MACKGSDGELSYSDFKFTDFAKAIFKQSAQEPFSFQLEFLDQITKEELRQYLAFFIVTGAKTLYNKELAELTPEERAHVQKYLRSIGWEVEYKVEQRMQKLNDKNPDKETPVNYFMIDFYPSKAIDKQNKPTL